MKKTSNVTHHPARVLAAATCAVLSLGLGSASAQMYVGPGSGPPHDPYREIGFYFNGDIGPSFMPEFHSTRFGFPGRFELDPGVRFSAEPGFNFLATDSITLGAQFETGVIYNYISSVKNAGMNTNLRGDYYQVPVLGDLVLQLHPCPYVTPFIGVGGGGDYSAGRLHMQYFYHDYTDSDIFSPAVEGMAGVRFRINYCTELGIDYKYLAAYPNHSTRTDTHSVAASFSVKF